MFGTEDFAAGVAWSNALNRLQRAEERIEAVEGTVGQLSSDLSRWRMWGQRGAVLLAIWGSLGFAGLNQDEAASLLATVIKTLLGVLR